jgi:hypothetical protein
MRNQLHTLMKAHGIDTTGRTAGEGKDSGASNAKNDADKALLNGDLTDGMDSDETRFTKRRKINKAKLVGRVESEEGNKDDCL